jgi:protein-S-isoprenylcysteine O-methyltransferase Ste14
VALAMWLLSSLLPRVAAPLSGRLAVAAAIGLTGIAFSGAGSMAFKRAKTSFNPLHPELASSLVTSGVYRVTRNPMYVGMLLGLLAWAVGLASPVSLAGPVAFIIYINRFQIAPEEKALAAQFGREFEAYKSSVRRWL